MNIVRNSIALTLSLFAMQAWAQQTTTRIKVAGNCEQCKTRIEAAAQKVQSISTANWDEASNQLTINYTGTPEIAQTVEKAIADAGHDTEHMPTNDKAYKKLPDCCKYERLQKSTSQMGKVQTLNLKIGGMTCAEGCAKGIETAIYQQKGVKLSEVYFDKGTAKVIYDTTKINKQAILNAILSFHGEGNKITYTVAVVE